MPIVLVLMFLLLNCQGPLNAANIAVDPALVPPAQSSCVIDGKNVSLSVDLIDNRMPGLADQPPNKPYVILSLSEGKKGEARRFTPEAVWIIGQGAPGPNPKEPPPQTAWSVSFEEEKGSVGLIQSCHLRDLPPDGIIAVVVRMKLEDGSTVTLKASPVREEVW